MSLDELRSFKESVSVSPTHDRRRGAGMSRSARLAVTRVVAVVLATAAVCIAFGGTPSAEFRQANILLQGAPTVSESEAAGFLSAAQAQKEMNDYWSQLGQTTIEEDKAGVAAHTKSQKILKAAGSIVAPAVDTGPLTDKEARRSLSNFWDREIRQSSPLMIATKSLAGGKILPKRAKEDDVEHTEKEMERIWAREEGGAGSREQAHNRSSSSGSTSGSTSLHSIHSAASSSPHKDDAHNKDGEAAPSADAHSTTTALPLCDHCSAKTFNWPVWNHRVDRALAVAVAIASGTKYNATLHPAGGSDASAEQEAATSSDDDALARQPEETEEEQAEVAKAMETLRGAVKALGESGGDAGSQQDAKPQCLSVCYNQLETLLMHKGIRVGASGRHHADADEDDTKVEHALQHRHAQHAADSSSAGEEQSAEVSAQDDAALEHKKDLSSLEERALQRAAKVQVEVQQGEQLLHTLIHSLAPAVRDPEDDS